MAFGANLGRLEPKCIGGWINNIMHTVTVDTGGDIGIAFLGQRGSMNALFIGIVNCTVTACAYFRDAQTGSRQEGAV